MFCKLCYYVSLSTEFGNQCSYGNWYLQAEGSSADCIAALARVDNVKQRMEAAYKTLQVSIHSNFVIHHVETWVDLQLILFFLVYGQDAAGLTQLSSTVEDVFASGDLPRAAETLASMRNCLSAVGEVVLISGSAL